MSFILGRSEEQRLLGETLERLGRDVNAFESRRMRLHAQPPDRMAMWPHLAGIGALGFTFEEARGGFGGTARDVAVLMDAIAPCLPVEPIVPALVAAARILRRAGGDGTDALVAGTIAGARVPVVAHVEGFDPFEAPRLVVARKAGGGYVLEGSKPAVRGADVATDLLVSARLPEGGTGIFRVARDAAGLTCDTLRLIDGAGAADLSLSEVVVADGDLLPLDDPLDAFAEAQEWSIMALAVETASLVRAANRATFGYLDVRVQFGQKLARFQALQHKAADMAIAQAEAEAVASRAIDLCSAERSRDNQRLLLLASLASDAAGRAVGHAAIQLHGGMGVSDELVVSHYGRRLAAIRMQVATADARQARLVQLQEGRS